MQTNGKRSVNVSYQDTRSNPANKPIAERLLDGLHRSFELQKRQTELLEKILEELQEQRPLKRTIRPMSEYPNFDWEAFGATVINSDQSGAGRVEFKGQFYTRRTNDKYGPEIWFSRCTKKDESGNNVYETLIEFRVFEPPSAIGNRAANALSQYKAP